MKNQTNKATVKNGLPTAEEVIDKYPMEKDFWSFVISRESAIRAMQEYSDQQNAGLREKLSRLGAMHEDIVVENAKIREGFRQKDERIAVMEERVKELEGALTATLNVARAYDRSRFVDILDKAEKTLKK